MQMIGIDHSITSPMACVCVGEPIPSNCWFYGFAKTKKQLELEHPRITLLEGMDSTSNRIARFHHNAKMILNSVMRHNDWIKSFNIEGYSFGSRGASLTQIAENGGILRYLLWKADIEFNEIAPSSIKKMATGRGNAKKPDMYKAWLDCGGEDLLSILGVKNPESNPLSDIVDSFFIMRAGIATT